MCELNQNMIDEPGEGKELKNDNYVIAKYLYEIFNRSFNRKLVYLMVF